ncbi:MAG: FAD/NAD(P)-binding protein [Acidimicrobiia bacterium]
MALIATESNTPALHEPMLPRPFRVTSKQSETLDTVTLEFEVADDGPPLAFLPGQFTMLYIYGVGEVPISICGDPNHPERLIHTVRAVGAVTNAICALAPGEMVGIRGPFGTGWPVTEGKDLVIVAGGIGLAPVRPLIYHALANRDRYFCLGLAYGSRSPSELLYRSELEAWNELPDFNLQMTVDKGNDTWRGSIGVVTPLIPRLRCEAKETIAVVCGPEVMMKVVARALNASGVARDNIYLSLERNMKCGIGFCGHCQFGSDFICKDGPVFPYSEVAQRLGVRSL